MNITKLANIRMRDVCILPDQASKTYYMVGPGGYLLSKLIVGGINKNVPALSRFVVDDFKEMDPAHPEPPPVYLQQSPAPGAPRRGPRGAGTAPVAPGKTPMP